MVPGEDGRRPRRLSHLRRFELIWSARSFSLERALFEMVRRHETLRTCFTSEGGEPVQVVHPPTSINLPRIDLAGLPPKAAAREAMNLAAVQTQIPFDLAVAPMFRVALVRCGGNHHVFLYTMHHIIFDGWSADILVRELSAFYQWRHQKDDSPYPMLELSIQYADFAAWQRQWLNGGVLESQLDFWASTLRGAPPLLALPTDRPRPKLQSYRGAHEVFMIDDALSRKINLLSEQYGVSLFMFLQTTFLILLSRYSRQEDISLGSPVANRRTKELEPLIGFFVNTLIMRNDLSGDPSFPELLGRVRKTALGAFDNQDVPFEQVVERLQPERSLSFTPLFQAMFMLDHVAGDRLELPGLTLDLIEKDYITAKFDLTLWMGHGRTGILGHMEYVDLFQAETIRRMLEHYQNLLHAIVANPEQRVAGLSMMSDADRHRLLTTWNETESEIPSASGIDALFEVQCKKTPDSVALFSENQIVTFETLNNNAENLAYRLRSLGVALETVVGVLTEREPAMVGGLLAILKTGARTFPWTPLIPKTGFLSC